MTTPDLTMTFGPLAAFMSDPTIEEIWVNSPERIFIARAGKNELTNLLLTSNEVRNIVERALMWSGRRLDLSHPFVDARLPDGSRLHVAIPEITPEHWAINIRKHLLRNLSLADLSLRDAMTKQIATLLASSVRAGVNILVSGGTQAGKTTMLNALVSAIPVQERVITIEEVFELKPNLPDVVSMQTRSCTEIAVVTGRVENDRIEMETLWCWSDGKYERGLGALPHPEKYVNAGIVLTDGWIS